MSEIQPIVMPKWGLSMEEGTLTAWLVKEGETVKKGQEIAEIESTKIANVFEAPRDGHLRRLVAKVGDVLPVGALLAVQAPAATPEAEVDAFVAGFVVVAAKEDEAGGGISEKRFTHNDRAVAYKAAGADKTGTPAVLVHGFGGDSDNWLFNIEALAAERPVYAIDLPGHGKSDKHIERGDVGELADAVLALMDEVGVARAHLVGHSLGGATVFEVLARAPGSVASLTGLAPAGLGDTINAEFVRAFVEAEKRKDVKAVLQNLFADPELVSTAMIEGVQRFKRLEGAQAALAKIAAAAFPGGRQAAGYRGRLGGAPTLIVWGERDAVLDPKAADALPAGVEVMRLANVGHMPHMEAASAVNEALARHFAKAG